MKPCPECGARFANDNGALLSDLDYHVIREHGGWLA